MAHQKTPAIIIIAMNLLALVYYYISVLMIQNVHITQCRGPLPSTGTLYPNDTAFYFHEGQSVTLLVSYSCYIMLFGVSINNYYGFSILLINVNNNVTFNNVNITSKSSSAQYSDKVLPVVVDQEL